MADEDDPTAYAAAIVDEYDDIYGDVLDTEGAVVRLAELAAGGPVLELGIGTGRLALPLAERGLAVHGIESSAVMVERLREKPGGAGIAVEIGDFTEVSLGRGFSLVVLAFNTIYAVPDQDAQVRVFQNAAAHLDPGGRFVVEAWVPDVAQFRGGRSVRPRLVGGQRVAIVVAEHDPVHQRMRTTQVDFSEGGVRLYPANHRYAWPAELDLMARLAGLELEHRWGAWDARPFTEHSNDHVSVYRKPSA